MDTADAVRMEADERDEFLGTSGVGVLSLAVSRTEPPHSVPISYGYDPTENAFYFRLAVGPKSGKGELANRAVTFVTVGTVDDRWKSVVANGHLRSTTDEAIETEALAGLDRVTIPLFDVFGRPTGDVSFEFYQLQPEQLTGRVERYSLE